MLYGGTWTEKDGRDYTTSFEYDKVGCIVKTTNSLKNGEGVHHIAFNVNSMDEAIKNCKEFGMTLEQRGEFAGGDGRYAYVDARKDLKIVLELLEND
jgi:hypothetical protein